MRCKNCGAPKQTAVCRYCDDVARVEVPGAIISVSGELTREQAQAAIDAYKRAAKNGDPLILGPGVKLTMLPQPIAADPFRAGVR